MRAPPPRRAARRRRGHSLSAAALALLIMALPAAAVELSSSAISDPHQLVRGVLGPSTAYLSLTVFPEHLVYEVSWGILHVGQATLAVEDILDFAGRPAYHVVSRAVSNKFCDTFYKVRDLNESWIDARTLASLGYSKKLREGHYFRDQWLLYDRGRFLEKSVHKDGNFSHDAGTVPASVQDVLSSLYYVRSKSLEPGSEVVLDVNTRTNWPLVVRVIRRERVRVPAGEFATILVEPALRHEGLFIQKGRRLQVWLTDDARRMPVLLKVEVFFGHISARLAKML